MNKSCYLLPFSFFVLLFISCEKNEEQEFDFDEYDVVSLDISNVSNAEKLFINREGCYILQNTNPSYGREFFLFNTLDRDIEDGITVVLDENHLPQYALFEGHTVFFGAFTEDRFEYIVQDPDGNQSCYWDMPLDDNYFEQTTKARVANLQTKQFIGSAEY